MKLLPIAPAALLLTLAPLAAQGSILPYLPKDTMMAVAAPDLSTSIGELAKMPLAKMWAEQDVQAFFADVMALARKKLDEGMQQAKEAHAQGAFPIDPEDLLKLRLHGFGFGLTKMEIKAGPRGPRPSFGMVLHLNFGDSAPTWNRLLQVGLGMMESEARDDLQKQVSKIGDIEMRSYLPPAEAGIDMGLHIAMVPNGLLVGTLASDVREVVAAMTAKTPMLGASIAYQTTAAKIDTQGAECEMFMRPSPMIDFAVGAMRVAVEEGELDGLNMEGIERAVDAMGLRKLGSVGMTSNYVDGKCVSRSVNAAEGEATTAAVKTVDSGFLKWVPKDAVTFGAGTMDVMSVYDMLLRGLNAYDAEFAKRALGQLAKMETKLGFTIKDDFFGAIGDHYITWQMPMGTISSPPEMAFLVKVNDEQRIVNVIKNLAKLTNGMVEIEEGEKRGVMAYQIRINYDPTQGRGVNPLDMLQLTFAFKQGYLVLGFSASDVKRVFQRMDRKDDDPKGDIRSNKEFAAVAASFPKAVTSMSFTDWKANFESLYQMGTGLLAFIPMGEEVPIDMSLIPDSGTLTKHLFGSVSYSTAVANSSESVSVSPFGPEVALLLVGAMGAGAALFVSMRGF